MQTYMIRSGLELLLKIGLVQLVSLKPWELNERDLAPEESQLVR